VCGLREADFFNSSASASLGSRKERDARRGEPVASRLAKAAEELEFAIGIDRLANRGIGSSFTEFAQSYRY
jgi:hypothetical protein